MTAVGVGLAFAAGSFFLWLGLRSPKLGERPTRQRQLASAGLRFLYLFSGVSLLVRGAIALSMAAH
jgi:hypothetical protein